VPAPHLLPGQGTKTLLIAQGLGLVAALAAAMAGRAGAAAGSALGAGLGRHGGDLAVERAALLSC
jgi:hypothetical protein